MSALLHPGLHVRTARNAPPMPLRIDVPALIGIARRGPIGRVQAMEGWPQFVATYGDFSPDAFLAYAVRGFFDNGGTRCHVLRVAAPALETHTTGAQPADRAASVLEDTARVRPGALATLVQTSAALTQGPQPADRKGSVMVGVAGMVAGNSALLRQAGRKPAMRDIVAVDGATNTITWGEALPPAFDITAPITVISTARDRRLVASVSGATVGWTRPLDNRFDLGKTIHVGFGAGVANGLLYDEEGEALLSIQAASPGVWGNALSVRLTTRISGDYATRQRSTPDAADRLSLDRVDGLVPGSTVEIAQDGAGTVRNTIAAVDIAERQITLETPLAGFDPAGAADGTKPIRLRRYSADLSVSEAGRLVEIHADMDLPTVAAPDASPVNAASRLIAIARLPGTEGRWFDPDSPMLPRGELHLDAGRDGIAMLEARDFTGVAGDPPAGLALFEDEPEPAAIALPDIMLPPSPARERLDEPPPEPDPCALCPGPVQPAPPPTEGEIHEASPGFSQAAIEAIQREAIEHCERRGDRVAVLDLPLAADGDGLDWPDLQRWRQQFDSSYAVCYHPWLDAAAPLDGRLVRRIPACGHALGQFALADRTDGRAAPANSELAFTAATAGEIDNTRHAMLNECGINAIVARSGRGIRIMGARTMASHPDWKQLTTRRLLIRLKRAIRRDLAWAVFEPANNRLEDAVIAALESLLEREWQAGRLLGRTAADAFRIGIDRNAAAIDNGEFVVLVALAPSQPAEFVFLRLAFTLDAMEVAELTAEGGWPT